MPEKTTNLDEYLEFGILYHNSGNLEAAENIYKDVLNQDPSNSKAHHYLGLLALNVGQHSIAKELLETSTYLCTDNPVYFANLGASYYCLQETEKAIDAYQKAISLDDSYVDAYVNMGIILSNAERNQEAIEAFEQAVYLDNNNQISHAYLAKLYFKENDHEKAEAFAGAAFGVTDYNPDVLAIILPLLQQFNKSHEAIIVGEKLIKMKPEEIKHYLSLCQAYLDAGFFEKAEKTLRISNYIQSVSLEYEKKRYLLLGVVASILYSWDEGIYYADKSLKIEPHFEKAIAFKAKMLERKGMMKESYELIKPYIMNKRFTSFEILNSLITAAQKYGVLEEAKNLLHNTLKQFRNNKRVEMNLNFQLGEVNEKLKDYDAAFTAYNRANELKPRDYNKTYNERVFEGIKECFTRDKMHGYPQATFDDIKYIFIVGMPRSGTSLTEQILDSHSQVQGCGELQRMGDITRMMPEKLEINQKFPHCVSYLTPELANDLSRYYTEFVKQFGEDKQVLTDKLPQNFLLLGLIALLVPQAKLIHCIRNPMDTCLSNYFQNFTAAGLSFAYDLDDLAHYYSLYWDLMNFWYEHLPIPIFSLRYEELVTDPDKTVKAVLDHCELPWEDNCLQFYKNKRYMKTASYDQVRSPLYTKSMQRWKNYRTHLKPLIEGLQAYGVPLEL